MVMHEIDRRGRGGGGGKKSFSRPDRPHKCVHDEIKSKWSMSWGGEAPHKKR